MTALAQGLHWSRAELLAMDWDEMQFWSEHLRTFFEEQAAQAKIGG
nr:hypothetical protein [uncultured Acetobacter sp.]